MKYKHCCITRRETKMADGNAHLLMAFRASCSTVMDWKCFLNCPCSIAFKTSLNYKHLYVSKQNVSEQQIQTVLYSTKPIFQHWRAYFVSKNFRRKILLCDTPQSFLTHTLFTCVVNYLTQQGNNRFILFIADTIKNWKLRTNLNLARRSNDDLLGYFVLMETGTKTSNCWLDNFCVITFDVTLNEAEQPFEHSSEPLTKLGPLFFAAVCLNTKRAGKIISIKN